MIFGVMTVIKANGETFINFLPFFVHLHNFHSIPCHTITNCVSAAISVYCFLIQYWLKPILLYHIRIISELLFSKIYRWTWRGWVVIILISAVQSTHLKQFISTLFIAWEFSHNLPNLRCRRLREGNHISS